MASAIDFNRRGLLLEELVKIKEPSERERRLFEVIGDIRGIVAAQYANEQGLEKLEDQLDNYESFDREELQIISRGVKSELMRGLDRNPSYSRDTVNEVFIALYKNLILGLKDKRLDEVVDYSRRDNTGTGLSKLVRQLNIYYVLSSWVTDNKRSIGDLDQKGEEQATQQFRDLKKSARGFVRGFRRLLRRSYNVESAYGLFSSNRNLETYEDARSVVEGTIRDCKKIVSDSNSNVESNGIALIRKFAEITMLNAEYYFLQMGYEMLHDKTAMPNIPDVEKFTSDLRRDAFDTSKIRYLSMMPNGSVTIFPEVNKLSPEVREFYQTLKPK